MKNKRYYAALLTGCMPLAIKDVYAFSYLSQKKQWLTEKGYFVEGERVSITSKIAKKHKAIEVTFGQYIYRDGSIGWIWFYDDIPE